MKEIGPQITCDKYGTIIKTVREEIEEAVKGTTLIL